MGVDTQSLVPPVALWPHGISQEPILTTPSASGTWGSRRAGHCSWPLGTLTWSGAMTAQLARLLSQTAVDPLEWVWPFSQHHRHSVNRLRMCSHSYDIAVIKKCHRAYLTHCSSSPFTNSAFHSAVAWRLLDWHSRGQILYECQHTHGRRAVHHSIIIPRTQACTRRCEPFMVVSKQECVLT